MGCIVYGPRIPYKNNNGTKAPFEALLFFFNGRQEICSTCIDTEGKKERALYKEALLFCAVIYKIPGFEELPVPS